MKDFLAYPIVALIVYFVCAFVTWSWDAGSWTIENRVMAVIFWLVFSNALSNRIRNFLHE